MSEFVYVAEKTLEAIENAIAADQGGAFRQWEQKVLPHIEDAYRGKEDGFRTHLGASMVGDKCARKVYYGFRWAIKQQFSGRILRLFNRGHLEEGRIIAALLTIGMQIYQQDANGHQFRISEAGGHFGGSGDGLGLNCPDLPAGIQCLLEFKTHGEKSFIKLKKEGLRSAKPEHYVQMQTYMHKMGLQYGLYVAVNKNTDELMAYIVLYDGITGPQYIQRGVDIIFTTNAPAKMSVSAAFFECKFCPYLKLCHYDEAPNINCRTCAYSHPASDGTWVCGMLNKTLSKQDQLNACEKYIRSEEV